MCIYNKKNTFFDYYFKERLYGVIFSAKKTIFICYAI